MNDNKAVSKNLYNYGLCARFNLPVDWLKEHRDIEVYDKLYQYKRLKSFINQYGSRFKSYISDDGRIHPKYYKHTATTGRYSAKEPAAMSLDGRLMKYMCAEKGNALLSFDFKTMDFRALAALSRDNFLISDLNDPDFDIHLNNASIIFNKEPKMCDESERKVGKSLGLAIIYGMTPESLAKLLTQKTKRNVSIFDAMNHIEKFYKQYSIVRKYQENLLQGIVACKTLGGHVFDQKLTRAQKLNYPVQSTSAEGFEKSVDAVENISREFQICLTVHDSIYVEVPQSTSEESAELIKNQLEKTMTNYLRVNAYTKKFYFGGINYV